MPRRTGYSVPTMTRSRRLWSALVSFASPGPVNCFYRLWHSRKRCAVGFPAHPASTGNNSKSRQRRPMTHTVWGWLKRSVRDQRAMANIQSTCIMWSRNWVTQCVMEVIFLSYWATFKKKIIWGLTRSEELQILCVVLISYLTTVTSHVLPHPDAQLVFLKPASILTRNTVML